MVVSTPWNSLYSRCEIIFLENQFILTKTLFYVLIDFNQLIQFLFYTICVDPGAVFHRHFQTL